MLIFFYPFCLLKRKDGRRNERRKFSGGIYNSWLSLVAGKVRNTGVPGFICWYPSFLNTLPLALRTSRIEFTRSQKLGQHWSRGSGEMRWSSKKKMFLNLFYANGLRNSAQCNLPFNIFNTFMHLFLIQSSIHIWSVCVFGIWTRDLCAGSTMLNQLSNNNDVQFRNKIEGLPTIKEIFLDDIKVLTSNQTLMWLIVVKYLGQCLSSVLRH